MKKMQGVKTNFNNADIIDSQKKVIKMQKEAL